MKNKTWLAVAAVVVLLVLGALLLWRWGPTTDRFDYAAAFEQAPDAAGLPALLDVTTLVGRTPQQVETLLGSASDCEEALHSRRCDYAQSPVQIVFIANRADWFTIRTGGQDLPLSAQSLARLGLPVREPDEVSADENLWRDLAGLKEVRMVGDEYGVNHVRIKAITP